jgi:hypothetical protein
VGPWTRRERPATGVRVRGKATALPEMIQDPTFVFGLCWGVAGDGPRVGAALTGGNEEARGVPNSPLGRFGAGVA